MHGEIAGSSLASVHNSLLHPPTIQPPACDEEAGVEIAVGLACAAHNEMPYKTAATIASTIATRASADVFISPFMRVLYQISALP